MSVEFDRESPGKFDSRTLNRQTLSRWTGRSIITNTICITITIIIDFVNIIIIIIIINASTDKMYEYQVERTNAAGTVISSRA